MFDPQNFLENGEEYDDSSSLSSKAITWTKSKETKSAQNCVTEGSGMYNFKRSISCCDKLI